MNFISVQKPFELKCVWNQRYPIQSPSCNHSKIFKWSRNWKRYQTLVGTNFLSIRKVLCWNLDFQRKHIGSSRLNSELRLNKYYRQKWLSNINFNFLGLFTATDPRRSRAQQYSLQIDSTSSCYLHKPLYYTNWKKNTILYCTIMWQFIRLGNTQRTRSVVPRHCFKRE